MAKEYKSGDLDTLSESGQALLATGRAAEAAALFGELLNRLDAEGSNDVHQRADLARLQGNALREVGDLAASTRSLESAVALLKEKAATQAQDFLLAAALKSVALNYDMGGESARATRTRSEMLTVVGCHLGSLPERASEYVFALCKDMESTGRTDWKEPIAWLTLQATKHDEEVVLRVLRKRHSFWLARGDQGPAQRVVGEAVDYIGTLDSQALQENFTTLHNLAWAAIQSNLLDVASEIADQAREAANTVDKRSLYFYRRLQATLSHLSGRREEALDQFRSVYKLAFESFGAEDPATRLFLRDLADKLADMNHRDEAIAAYDTALEVELQVNDNSAETAEIASILGRLLDTDAQFVRSAEMHRLALSIQKEMLGSYHPVTNKSRYEVAELSRILDRVEEAELFFLQALEVDTKLGLPDADLSALIRNNLADLYIKLGRYEEASPLLEEAIAMRIALYGEDSERAWRSRQSLAILARDTGNTVRAVALARKALEHPEQNWKPSWYYILASALLKEGNLEEAEDLFLRLCDAVSEDDNGDGAQLNEYLKFVEGLMLCRLRRKAWAETAESAFAVPEKVRLHLLDLAKESSEVRLTRFVRRVMNIQALWLRALSQSEIQDPEHLAAAFELVQLTKGLRTRYLRWRQPGVANVDHIAPPEHVQALREVRDEIRQLQSELTAAFLELGDAKVFATSRTALARCARLRKLERHLARGITDWEIYSQQAPVLSDHLLPDGAMALEFVVVRDLVSEQNPEAAPAHRYAAFVLGPSEADALALIDLGLTEDLDEAVTTMRDSLMSEPRIEGARPPAWSRLSRFLGRAVLAPVWQRIESAQHLLIVPDGGLGALPFGILTTPEGGYLLDKLRVSYLMRTGELRSYGETFRLGEDPLVMAGPDYDLPNAFKGRRLSQSGAEYFLARTLGGGKRFEPLPEARNEGATIAALLGVEPLNGVWALAPALGRSNAPEILHLSTHGFCLPLESTVDDVLALFGPLGNALDRRMVLTDPMHRSGLAMSGVNAVLDGRSLPPEVGDGVVYASDIQQMNLQRTDLVVLSACRSGLGDVEIGDGAHGLRRAFLAAGCRSVVSTLWDIPETSSRRLLEHFYKRLLDGVGRLEALTEAQALVRKAYPHDPIHWAGFVLDGTFEPLWRFSRVADLKVASVNFSAWMNSTATPRHVAEQTDQEDPDGVNVVALRHDLTRDDLDDQARVRTLGRHADLANRLGDNERAITDLQAMLAMDVLSSDQRIQYTYNVAKIFHQMGRLEEALSGYTEVLDDNPSAEVHAITRVNRGFLLLETNHRDEGVSDFTAVIDDVEAPVDQRFMAYMNRSAALETDDPRRALSDVEAALALDLADDIEILRLQYHRARIQIRLGERVAALDTISELEGYPQASEEFRERIAKLRSAALRL